MDAQGCDDVIDPQEQRVQRAILGHLREAHCPQPGTWQAALTFAIRAGVVWSIYNAIILANPDIPSRDVLQMAFGNENERFAEEHSRDEYVASVKSFLGRLQATHRQRMQAVPNSINPGNNVANMQEGVVRQTPHSQADPTNIGVCPDRYLIV